MTTPPALPPPPASSFASDNAAGVSPEVMDALVAANDRPGPGLRRRPLDRRPPSRTLRDAVRRAGRGRARAGAAPAPTWSGLATVLQALAVGHLHRHRPHRGRRVRRARPGSPGRRSRRCPTSTASSRPRRSSRSSTGWAPSTTPSPRVLSISQVTEMGTVYTADEIAALCDLAHAHDMLVHVDGARIANAVAATGGDLRDARSSRPGVDVHDLRAHQERRHVRRGGRVPAARAGRRSAAFVRKQAGQLPSKARFVAAQVSALLADDLWLRNAAPRQRHGGAAGRAGRRHPRRRGAPAARRPTPCSPASRSTASPRCRRGRSSGSGTSASVAGAVDDELRHHRRTTSSASPPASRRSCRLTGADRAGRARYGRAQAGHGRGGGVEVVEPVLEPGGIGEVARVVAGQGRDHRHGDRLEDEREATTRPGGGARRGRTGGDRRPGSSRCRRATRRPGSGRPPSVAQA